jgi:Bifunctional DNA primase/polymerase, N-terminal/Primase C terminal 1 (PriCT-1)
MDSYLLMNEAIDAYIGHGWSIIPIRSGDKRPLVRWEEFQYRCPRAEEVHTWFSGWPDAGIGVVTGAVSGLIVLDIDPEHGGEASLERLQSQHDRLPTTVECRSGGGGRHLYFAHPGAVVRNKAGLAPGVDLRGDGGYVVAPPSLHASGLRYVWVGDRRPKMSDLAPLPGWVLQLAVDQPGRFGHSIAYWRRLVREGVREGERNNTIASLAGHLLRHDVDASVVMEVLLCWNRVRCQPPLTDDEVVAVVESIKRRHERDDWRSTHRNPAAN